jgi:hypothetical protein
MATIDVKDAAGVTQTLERPLAPGRVAAASSRPVVLSTEDLAALNAISAAIGAVGDASVNNPASSGTLIALFKGALDLLNDTVVTTTTPVKTAAQALLAHTQQATAAITIGSAVDVSAKLGPATVFVKMGRTVATALSANVKFRLESSAKTSGNDEWVPLYEWQSTNGLTAASSTTLNDASVSAADTTFTLTSGTGFIAGDHVYLRETGTPANSEWVRAKSIATNDLTIEEGLTRGHTNGINVSDLAESWCIPIDVSGHARIRLVVDTASAASGQTVDVIGWLVTLDSASTT